MKGTIMNYVVCFLLITIVKAFDPEVYLKTRGQLVGEEYDASLSGNITMNPKEVMANEILTSLLVKEAAIMGDYFAPSMNFFQAHGWIDNTSILFPLIKQMPKGVIHHLHSDSSASYGWLVSNLTYSPYCYIFQGQSEEYASGSLSMFKSPPSSDWINVNELRNKSGNTEQFDFNLLRSLTMENQDFGDYNQLWNKFDGIFGRLRGLLYYKDAYEGYLQHMVTEMLNDNVQNIELKLATTLTLYDLDNNVYDLDYIITFVSNLINQTREIEPAFTMKLIMANLRRFNETTIFPLLQKSLYYRNKYPDIVVGFDLDGPEDDGFSLLYFLDDFSAIANISANYTYDLPYYFHAGETLMANNTNLYDAVLLGSYRIGHAFQLAKHQGLTEMVKQQNIGLEICPISNQILQYIFDIRGHPALEYFNRGLLMTISPDDPALYGYGGVSYDWYEVLLAWSLDIPGLKQLAINSYIKGSFFNEEERMNSYNAWQTQWNAWIDWILKGYAYSNL